VARNPKTPHAHGKFYHGSFLKAAKKWVLLGQPQAEEIPVVKILIT